VRPKPDYKKIHAELKCKGVTLQLLWKEYKDEHPDGFGYTHFCVEYQKFANTLAPIMRFNHKAGEHCFVDYAGLTMEWIEPATGEIHHAEIFVGALGASHLIYCEATATQSLPDFLGSHVRMFNYYGGVTEKLIPDNLRTGITKSHRYDPDLNPNYTLLAEHYGVAVLPARVREPTDKSKVEVGVQCVEREIIAPLRHHTFTSLAEINVAIQPLLEKLNHRPMQKIKLSRYQQFIEFEKAALKALPAYQFEYKSHKLAKVHLDYHVEIDKHYYSVPYRYIHKKVDVYLTENIIEIFYQGERIALHQRSYLRRYKFTTFEDHMPPNHRAFREELNDAEVEKLLAWAKSLGDVVFECVKKFFLVRTFPQQAIRAVLGLKRLHRQYGHNPFVLACQQALTQNRYRCPFIEEILKHDLTRSSPNNSLSSHPYCRGKSYYQ
jgi:transposase